MNCKCTICEIVPLPKVEELTFFCRKNGSVQNQMDLIEKLHCYLFSEDGLIPTACFEKICLLIEECRELSLNDEENDTDYLTYLEQKCPLQFKVITHEMFVKAYALGLEYYYLCYRPATVINMDGILAQARKTNEGALATRITEEEKQALTTKYKNEFEQTLLRLKSNFEFRECLEELGCINPQACYQQDDERIQNICFA